MVWQPEIDELNQRKELAYKLGGEERVQKHLDNGKLTIRDRIATLADENSFRERGVLAGKATYEDNELVDFRPSNYVMGLGKLINVLTGMLMDGGITKFIIQPVI